MQFKYNYLSKSLMLSVATIYNLNFNAYLRKKMYVRSWSVLIQRHAEAYRYVAA